MQKKKNQGTTMVHSDNGIFLRTKKTCTVKPWKDTESLILSEANPKACVLHDSNYMTGWKRQNYRDIKNISGCQRLERRRDELTEHRGFSGQ